MRLGVCSSQRSKFVIRRVLSYRQLQVWYLVGIYGHTMRLLTMTLFPVFAETTGRLVE